VPFCIFTDPELARVGMNESEAKARGIEYRLVKLPLAAVLRTRTLSEPRGFMKLLIDAYTFLRDAIFTHPTIAEGLTVLLANVPAKQAQIAA